METRTNNVNSIKRKVVSGIFITVFVLAFIFACLKNVLPIGKWIVGTFGILTYPMLIVLTLISLACFMGFSYTRSKKATTYFCILLFSILIFIQALTTFSSLNAVVNGKTLGEYLKLAYTGKVTLIGSAGSLVCGLISILLGAMGVVVVSVITATLFGGLFIDYQFYGKYEEPVKKLKTRAVREKVQKSDKKKAKNGEPAYTFNQEADNVVGEIETDDYSFTSTTRTVDAQNYNREDIVAEISNEQLTDDSTTFAETGFGYGQQPYEYEQQPYSSILNDDKIAGRREFIDATFGGGFGTAPVTETPQAEPELDFGVSVVEPEEKPIFTPTPEDTFDFGKPSTSLWGDEPEEDDELASSMDALNKILQGSDDSVDKNDDNDIFGTGFGSILKEPDPEPVARPTPVAVEPAPVGLSDDRSFEARNSGFKQQPTRPVEVRPQPAPPQYPTGFGAGTFPQQPKAPEKVVVPQKTMDRNPYGTGVNVGMRGLRYNPPPLSLLNPPRPDTGDYTAEQQRKSETLETVLKAFNIPVKVANIVRGPKITRYELSVPYGVSVDKIPRHENDIARALCAKTVTIKAPIPGSQYVGIELENDTFTSVCLRELLESKEFQNCKDPLPVVIGKDISGEIVVKSLTKMVHLLVAGSTGSGKSVFVHNMILSLLFKYSPDDLRFMLIDPKKVEFNIYNGLPHLLTPEVVLGADKALNALKWCVKEMDRRYDLMSKAGFNNIEPYNKSNVVKAGQFEKMPYIVIVIDEFAEVMVANKKEAEVCVQRITQLARACGMHLIIATQRPSVDVITGVIKNNIPSRVALSLQSGIDSKTILNTVGAEKLLGAGDMIFAPTGTSAWPRLQGAYATDDEIRAIIDYDIQNNTSSFDEAVMSAMDAEQTAPDSVGGGGATFVDSAPTKKVDSYFKIAIKHVMLNGGASVSYLQRRLSIGYSRAAKIIDDMEDRGFIAPATGAKVRKVLITPEQFREEFGEEYDSLD